MAKTMQVRLLESFQGPEFSGDPGEEISIAPTTAARLIERGLAEPVKGPKKRTATKKPKTETATTD